MSLFQSLAEGGQTFAHRVRMVRQVIKIAFVSSSIVGMIVFLSMMLNTSALIYQGTWYYSKALILENIVETIEVNNSFWAKIAKEHFKSENVDVPIKKVLSKTYPYPNALLDITIQHIKIASKMSFTTLFILIVFFLIRGRIFKGKKHLSGQKIISPMLVKIKLKLLRNNSPIHLEKLPLVKGTETQHCLITGGTGSGKSNCIHHLLTSIRKNKQKIIILDTTGSFVARFFRPDKDVILNPFCSHSASWHPWAECRDAFDYDALAESFIPQSTQDHENYWRQAGRSLFSSVLQKTNDLKKNSEISRWLLRETLHKLCQFVQDTKAASHMDINSDKTAASVRSVTASYVECFEHLKDTQQPFSIRDWVKNNEDSWLYIQCTPAQRASIAPLLSSWISIAIRSLLQLETSFDRRLWFVIDELASLQKIKDLELLVTEGRKYGGCGVLSLQSPAQLEAIYGRESSKTILGNCLTKIVFSEQNPEVSGKISQLFGQREIKEFQEGISYGAHEVRDGVNLSSQKKYVPIVSATDIQSLQKNTAFLRLPGHHPITRIKFSITR